jgi:exodeoxyribonuclease VII small subunit
MTAKRDGSPPFEELYGKLEATVEKLEKGGLSLEESIAVYEEGMELAKRCQALLDGAEQRIVRLRESFGQSPAPQEAPVARDDASFEDQEPFPLDEQ